MLADDALDAIDRMAEKNGWTVIRVDFDNAEHRFRSVHALDDRFGMRVHWMPNANLAYPRTVEVVVLSAKVFALSAHDGSRETFFETIRETMTQQQQHAQSPTTVPVDFMQLVLARTEAKLTAAAAAADAVSALKRKEGGNEKAEDSKTLKRRKAGRGKPRVK